MKKKICFVYSNIFNLGGIQKVITNLANHLVEKYDVTVVCTSKIYRKRLLVDYGLSDSVKVLYLDGAPFYFVMRCIRKVMLVIECDETKKQIESRMMKAQQKQLVKIFNQENYDAIFTAAPELCIAVGEIREKLHCKKVYGWWHHCLPVYEQNWLTRYGEERFLSQFTNLDKVLVLSKDDQRLIKEKYGFNTEVMYNAVANNTEGKSANLASKQIFLAGRYSKIKGFDRAIEAFSIVKQNCPEFKDWTVKIAGSGPEEKNLSEQIEELGLEQQVFLIGQQNLNQMRELFEHSSIYLMPSRAEGFPMALCEAMQWRLPVVVMERPVFHEMLPNDDFIVPQDDIDQYADRIIKLIRSEKLRKQEADKNYRKVQEFSMENISKQWIKIIEQ